MLVSFTLIHDKDKYQIQIFGLSLNGFDISSLFLSLLKVTFKFPEVFSHFKKKTINYIFYPRRKAAVTDKA